MATTEAASRGRRRRGRVARRLARVREGLFQGAPRRRPLRNGVRNVRRIVYGARRMNGHIPVVRRLPLVAYQDDDDTGTGTTSVPPGLSSTTNLQFGMTRQVAFNLGNLFTGNGSSNGGTDNGGDDTGGDDTGGDDTGGDDTGGDDTGGDDTGGDDDGGTGDGGTGDGGDDAGGTGGGGGPFFLYF
jgi:hypothetical protein